MSAGSVPCILQDHIGYLWFGTYLGIDRYDGYTFTSYRHDPENPASLVNAFVQTLCEDRAGNMWIGTQNGLDTLDRVTGKFTHFILHPPGPENPLSNFISSVHEDRDGTVWIGTGNGLACYSRSAGTLRYFSHDSTNARSLRHNSINVIYEDQSGSLWIGTGAGLDKLDRSTYEFSHAWHPPGDSGGAIAEAFDPQYSINAICGDADGILWLGTNGGVVKFDQRTGSSIRFCHDPKVSGSVSSDLIASICIGEGAGLWVGTYDHGLNHFDKQSRAFTQYHHDEKDPLSLSSDGIQSVLHERSGTLWISTINMGVNKLNLAKPLFTKYLYDNQIPGSFRPGIFETPGGRIAISTSKGWKEFDPETETFVRQPLRGGMFLLGLDRNSNVWLGADAGGVFMRDRHGHMVGFDDSSGHAFRRVPNCLTQGNDGRFWMGTVDGGLFAIDPARRTVRLLQQTESTVNTVFQDSYGLLWAGLWEGGMLCFDPARQTVVRYTSHSGHSSSLSGNTVGVVHEDSNRKLWICTNAGLNGYDRATGAFTHFAVTHGWPREVVFGILEDGHGNLWLSTLRGLSKFDPQTKQFTNYDISHGLASNDPGGGCRTRNGEMYFSGGQGLTRFHPDSIRNNPYIAPIVVTEVRLFEKPTLFDKEVHLSYSQNSVSFEFAALSYRNPERNQYAYKMEGIDPDWVESGSRRYAAYPHLDPGEYVFRVKGSNNDGVWNEKGTSIAILILPPFWETWWFRTLGVIAILLSVGGSIRYVDMKKLKRRIELLENERALQRERTRISQDMHDEVGAGLTEIGILSELAKRNIEDPGEAAIHLQRVAETSRETIRSIGEIIWAINPANDLLDDLVAYLRHYAARYLGATAITLEFDIPETIPDFHLSAEARRNIFLVVKEAIHNIVKHSQATAVFMRICFTRQHLDILVKDNGTGFSKEDLSRLGNGLRNMQKRMKDIGGTVEIESEPGTGTRVKVSATIGAV